MPKKKEYLRDCREKLNKAIKINPDAVTPDGELAVFQLVNAFYMTFIFEESDAVAEQLLEVRCGVKLAWENREKAY